MYVEYKEPRPLGEQANGLMWEMDEDGHMWAGWKEWDQIEEESPIFYAAGLDYPAVSNGDSHE